MDSHWIQSRSLEFDSMRFRKGKENENEEPLKFIQRRNRHATFLFPMGGPQDEPLHVARILSSAPASWEPYLNPRDCPLIYALLVKTRVNDTMLVNVWENARAIRRVNKDEGSTPRNRVYRRRAYTIGALLSDPDDDGGLEKGDEDFESEEESTRREAFTSASKGAQRSSSRGTSRNSRNTSSRPAWPDKPLFERDDSTHSTKPPQNGACYICSSPKHFARDCKHYGRWLSMRQDNRIHVGMAEAETIQEQDRLYSIVCAAESQSVSSYFVVRESEEESRYFETQESGAKPARSSEYSSSGSGARPARPDHGDETDSDSIESSETERGAFLAHSDWKVPESGATLARSGYSEGGAILAHSEKDGSGGGAIPAHPEHVEREDGSTENQNTRRRIQFEGKGKARENSPSIPRAIPQKESRRMIRKQKAQNRHPFPPHTH